MPEKMRSSDEAAVLVGNEKTLLGSEQLLKKVKHINPKCLKQMPTILPWRTGLSTAMRTTNPYVPTQDLFPGRGKRDHLLAQMNSGPRSVNTCPGRYTLPVAEFGGLATFNPSSSDPKLFDTSWLHSSPLRTAADNAEKVAEALARDPEVQRAGVQPYVYHDRTSSKVTLGAFNSPNDQNAVRLRDSMLRSAVAISERMKMGVVLAPGNSLIDLEDPNRPIKGQ
jgi:hypothetical protein